jgi:non-canonical (house-cleaning) NTP pyrophosphatase
MLPTDFWQRLKNGLEVAVAPPRPDVLLGVRDGFLRFFHDGMASPVPVAVVGQSAEEEHQGLLLSDEEVVRAALVRAQAMRERLGSAYHFYVTSEAGLHTVEADGRLCTFVRNWVAVIGPDGEAAFGGSGSVQIPDHLVSGSERATAVSMPGRRRKGGLISSLTGGLETRRSAVAVSTLHAISTLLYGVLESRPIRTR